MLVLGWRTAVLGLISVQVLVLAAALAVAPRNRAANRILAGLLVVVVGLLTPFTIGFAGVYDAWPWLSFAPFAIPLAVGPLAWAYTVALTTGRAPERMGWHLVPALAQLAWGGVGFALPPSLWDHVSYDMYAPPLIAGATLLSLVAYGWAARQGLSRYRAGLGDVVSDPHRFAATWLGRGLALLIGALALRTGGRLWGMAVGSVGAVDPMGPVLVLSVLALGLGLEGWRHADLLMPVLTPAKAPDPAGRDWRLFGERWAERTRREGWWREPGLSLAELAARLGANRAYLSRALNAGLGVDFVGFVNGLRARAVAEALVAGRDASLTVLAREAGFSSRASFERAFRAEFGTSPSAWREAHGSAPKTAAPLPVSKRAAS